MPSTPSCATKANTTRIVHPRRFRPGAPVEPLPTPPAVDSALTAGAGAIPTRGAPPVPAWRSNSFRVARVKAEFGEPPQGHRSAEPYPTCAAWRKTTPARAAGPGNVRTAAQCKAKPSKSPGLVLAQAAVVPTAKAKPSRQPATEDSRSASATGLKGGAAWTVRRLVEESTDCDADGRVTRRRVETVVTSSPF